MLASACIMNVHNYSFPSILNSARASYSRRHRLTEANTQLMSVSRICLTVSDIYSDKRERHIETYAADIKGDLQFDRFGIS